MPHSSTVHLAIDIVAVMTRRGLVTISAALVLLAQPLAALGDEQDSARQAYESGQVAGLPLILARVRSAFHGRVLEVELQRMRGGGASAPWIYEVKLLTPQGNVIKLQLNAKTTDILRVKGRGADAARKAP